MGAVRIVTDTTASLPPGYAAAHAVEVVPQVVLFGEESFFEEVQLSYAEFIRRLKAKPPRNCPRPPRRRRGSSSKPINANLPPRRPSSPFIRPAR